MKRKLNQMKDVCGNLNMFPVHDGTAKVLTAQLYRHAGDSKRGMKGSWFVEVRVRIEHDGHTVEPTAVMRRHDEHGESKKRCAYIAYKILLAGEINLKYWRVDHY